jgi:hypothetical protein
MIDYRPMKRVDAYAGVLWSQVTGGMASGYLYHINLAAQSRHSLRPHTRPFDRADSRSVGI